MDTELIKRIAFSILSGIGVGLILHYSDFFDRYGGGLGFYGASGLVFAAGVLFPNLKGGDRLLLRTLVLTIASGISYYSAVWLAVEGPFSGPDGWISFTIASIAGASIVLTALALVSPIRATREYVLYGLVAALVGGPITNVTLPKGTILILTGNAIWHMLICLAIYFAIEHRRRGEILR